MASRIRRVRRQEYFHYRSFLDQYMISQLRYLVGEQVRDARPL